MNQLNKNKYAVILCGGSGTRLWPLSRKNFPKQFLSLFSNKSLLQETFLLIKKTIPEENIFFISKKDNLFNIFNQIREISPNFNKDRIINEPMAMNTAPAIALAIKYLTEEKQVNPNDPIIFLPADHFITQKENYSKTIYEAMNNVGDNIGTLGIKPRSPETGFGYMKKGELIYNIMAHRVEAFKEKPNLETAKQYLASEQYFWNSGIYFFSANTFVREAKKYSPELYSYIIKPMDDFVKEFASMPPLSIDYAISEKSDKVVMFAGDFGWSDIGSFDSLAKLLADKKNKKHIAIDSKNVFVHSDHLVATLGVEDLNIIQTNDSILIAKQGRSEEVKKIVEILKNNKRPELEDNLIVHRPWGKYEVLINDSNHQVKRITVYPNQQLSLQNHYHRAEHWVVVRGVAKIIRGEEEVVLGENESTFIPALTKHSLSNPGKINLELIEVQTGNYLGEDDIIRYEDIYDRS